MTAVTFDTHAAIRKLRDARHPGAASRDDRRCLQQRRQRGAPRHESRPRRTGDPSDQVDGRHRAVGRNVAIATAAALIISVIRTLAGQ